MKKTVYLYDNGQDTIIFDDAFLAENGLTVDDVKKSVAGTDSKFETHTITFAKPVYRHHKEVERLCAVPDTETGTFRQDKAKRFAAMVSLLVEDWTLPYQKDDIDNYPMTLAAFLMRFLPDYMYGGQSLDENDPFGRLFAGK